MTNSAPTLAQIWRHPIKAHGAEHLACTALVAGKTMPWDRVWAVPHSAAKIDGGSWISCRNFTRGAGYPSLMAIDAQFNADTLEIVLSHPDRADFTFCPDQDTQTFLDWVSPLLPPSRPTPTSVIRATDQGMTDQSKPWISILNLNSLKALSEKTGIELDPRRFRGNLWLGSLPAWEEQNWLGKQIQIGSTSFTVHEPITRCRATEVDPSTGKRNVDTLDALFQNWGHRDFGVFAEVTKSGSVSIGDTVEVYA